MFAVVSCCFSHGVLHLCLPLLFAICYSDFSFCSSFVALYGTHFIESVLSKVVTRNTGSYYTKLFLSITRCRRSYQYVTVEKRIGEGTEYSESRNSWLRILDIGGLRYMIDLLYFVTPATKRERQMFNGFPSDYRQVWPQFHLSRA